MQSLVIRSFLQERSTPWILLVTILAALAMESDAFKCCNGWGEGRTGDIGPYRCQQGLRRSRKFILICGDGSRKFCDHCRQRYDRDCRRREQERRIAEAIRQARLAAEQAARNHSYVQDFTDKTSGLISSLKNKVCALFAGVKHRIWKKLFPRRRFNAECPICTDEFEAEDGTFLLDCNADGGHVYHLECLQGMIAAGHGATWNKCSLCNVEIFSENARDNDIPPELRDANRRRRQNGQQNVEDVWREALRVADP